MTADRTKRAIAYSGDKLRDARALVDLALRSSRKQESLALAREALELDGECTEAQIILAHEAARTPKELASLLRTITDRAEAKLGTPFLRDHLGRLGDLAEARAYLSAKMHLAEALEKAGRPALAIPHLEDLLNADREDRLGARYRMVRCLLATHDLKRLAAFLKVWEAESSAFLAWAAVLERIRSKSGKDAEKALKHARSINPHFEDFLNGRRKLPKRTLGACEPGSVEEAALAFRLFGETWTNDREGLYWLFRHE